MIAKADLLKLKHKDTLEFDHITKSYNHVITIYKNAILNNLKLKFYGAMIDKKYITIPRIPVKIKTRIINH